MPSDFDVVAPDLREFARTLKAADKEIKRDMTRGIKAATKRTAAEVKLRGMSRLPAGVQRWMAAGKVTTSVSTNAQGVRVRILGKMSGHDWRRIDAGRLRHPVFGNRDVWVTQSVEPGFFTEPIKDDMPRVRRAVDDVLDETRRRLERG